MLRILRAGTMVAGEWRRHDTLTARRGCVLRRIEPNAQVVDLHRTVGDRARLGVGEDSGRAGDRVRRRQRGRRKHEGPAVKPSDDIGDPDPVAIGQNIAVIPNQPEGRVRNLDVEDHEVGVLWQASGDHLEGFDSAKSMNRDLRRGSKGAGATRSFRFDHRELNGCRRIRVGLDGQKRGGCQQQGQNFRSFHL